MRSKKMGKIVKGWLVFMTSLINTDNHHTKYIKVECFHSDCNWAASSEFVSSSIPS